MLVTGYKGSEASNEDCSRGCLDMDGGYVDIRR
jgi:hypothetical protein